MMTRRLPGRFVQMALLRANPANFGSADILSNPHRHTELDGSGFVKGLVDGDRLDHVGQSSPGRGEGRLASIRRG